MSVPPSTPAIESVGFTTADAHRCAAFLCGRLGFQQEGRCTILGGPYAELIGLAGAHLRLVRLRLGAERIELTEVIDPGPHQRRGRPIAAEARSCDLSFQHLCLVVSDLVVAHGAVAPLIASGELRSISSAPQRLPSWNVAAAGIEAFKFRDPEGHALELLQFPPGKGDPRWQRPAADPDSPWLGIDHSAIAIGDSEVSQRFYVEGLGLRRGVEGLNSGVEQERLDGLAGARVRIVPLRCRQGPGLEGLQYLEPSGGRPIPADLGAQDLDHWQIRLVVDDLEAIRGRLISLALLGDLPPSTVVDLEGAGLGFRRALQLRDPDGHRIQLVQRSEAAAPAASP
ncbi:VOC family protein [Cyanobium sp. Morenito 9A2]|uniref:VOC family protein n=1 Tax=Cyanobium sp. Morenito 9A2 TaxID=2823718 RepID=UPI0020CE2D26|nr:lactoylglutathione lyase [Cyanobium sp. Morenito 9A2]MCP9849432.1 lactoylglutathione lyase [Cyanobium sp. Morenito 9A2]